MLKDRLFFSIEEFSYLDALQIQCARALFLNYFLDLYKEMIPIDGSTEDYLKTIFDKTEQSLETDSSLHAVLIYHNQNPVGFATFGLLEDSRKILIRTVAIDINYKDNEQDIRLNVINFIAKKYSKVTEIIMMIRKANIYHQELIHEIGFKKNNEIFNLSSYVKLTYDGGAYHGYVYRL